MASLSAVDYPNLEVVVIDGGSKDSTGQVLEEFSTLVNYSVSEPDSGIYDAMNKGLGAATGEYVWFVNSGDTVYDGEILKKIFSRGGMADIYYGETLIKSENGKILGLRKKPLPAKLTWHSFRKGMVVCHQSVIIKRSIAPQYDTGYRLAADVEWVLQSLKNAVTIVNTGKILSVFVEGGASAKHRKTGLKERFGIMRRHFGLFPTLLSHAGFVLDSFKPRYRKNNL